MSVVNICERSVFTMFTCLLVRFTSFMFSDIRNVCIT